METPNTPLAFFREKCTGCGVCRKVCPSGERCIECGTWAEYCSAEALGAFSS